MGGILRILKAVWGLIGGGGLTGLTEQLGKAYEAKLKAENDADRMNAEHDVVRIEAAIRSAEIANQDRWSATSLGRYLIVIPFGIWWAAIYLIQIVNPWVLEPIWGVKAIVYDIPLHIMDMARILVPAIVIADGSALVARRITRK